MQISIGPCLPADLDTLREIAYRTFDETFRPLNLPATIDQYLEDAFNRGKLAQELATEGSWFYFLQYGEAVAGYLKLNVAPHQSDLNEEDSLEIERIYVAKEYQGKGLGRSLIEFALARAIELGKRYAWLGVWEKNPDSIAFYSRMGFKEAGRHVFRMGEEMQTDLVMRRTVRAAIPPP